MKEEGPTTTQPASLRERAEASLRMTRQDVTSMSLEDVQRLVHELQVHQVELEMQNEELRQVQLDLQQARDRYAQLYELAPVAYVTLDAEGAILEANRIAPALLGAGPRGLIGRGLQEFVDPSLLNVWAQHLRHVFTAEMPQTCDLRLRADDGTPRSVRLSSMRAQEASPAGPTCRTVLMDLSERARLERALRENQARLEGIIASALDTIIGVSEDQRIVLFNPAAEVMFRCRERHAVGQPLSRFIPIRDLGQAFGASGVTGGIRRARGSLTALRSDGTEFPVEASISEVDLGEQKLFVAILRDVSDQQRAAQALRESEARYRAIVETQSELIARFLPDTTLTFVNEAYCRYFGKDATSLVGRSFLTLVPEAARAELREHIASLVASRQQATHETQVIAAAGHVRWQEWTNRPIVDERGRVAEFQACGRDITDRKEAAEALREGREQLRRLAAQLMTSEEESRGRLAAELHDDIGQRLAALCVEVDLLLQRRLESPETIRGCYDRLARITDDVQRLARGLHPVVLRDLGLPAALRAQVEEWSRQHGIHAVFRVWHVPEAVPEDLGLCIYRVAQEALRNVTKHAGPASVTVTAGGTRRGFGLCVADTGRGFDPASVDKKRAGLGLVSMAERVRALGGVFRVRTRHGDGTHVHAWLPKARGPR